MTRSDVLIIGGGQAGFQLAASLRLTGFDGPITMLSEEALPPYMRPPLSKGFVKDLTQEEDLPFRTLDALRDAKIDLHLETRAQSLDVAKRAVTAADGQVFGFDKLVFATGTRARSLPNFPPLSNVCALRTIEDARHIKQAMPNARHVTVIGGGFIGLEFAAVARQLGKEVLVVEAADRLLSRGLSPLMADWFLQLHRKHGVDVRLATGVTSYAEENGRLAAITLSSGERVATDLMIVGIGVVPNAEIAAAAGLRVDNGIVVNDYLETAAEGIFAIGDCASFPMETSTGLTRLESVQNAVDQAKYLATSICSAEAPKPYRAVPWFWTEQFDIKVQMAGLQQGHDSHSIIGSPAENAFTIEYFRDGRCISVDSINQPKSHLAARKQLASAA